MQQKDLYRGSHPQPTCLATPQIPWTELGTITLEQAYPDVDARDYTSVAALAATKRVIWPVHNQATGFMLRFQTTDDADAHVVKMLGFADRKALTLSGLWRDDHALFLGSLALTGGTQVGPNRNVFVDSIVATDGVWTISVLDHAADRIAVAKGDTRGIKVVVFIATTFETDATLYIDGRTY